MTEPCPAVDTRTTLPTPMPALPEPYAAYVPSERLAVADPARKLAAIGAYRSQLGDDPDHDWLTTFARTDEPFWPDPLFVRAPCPPVFLSRSAPDADLAPYHLHLSDDAETVTLTRGDRKLRRWLLPFDGRDRAHAFALAISRSDEGGREIALERDGTLIGIAIDPVTSFDPSTREEPAPTSIGAGFGSFAARATQSAGGGASLPPFARPDVVQR
jgi:hypothetical protein